MERTQDIYINNVYSDYCHFCGANNSIELKECLLCRGMFCDNCIAETNPEATFPDSNLESGLYCYKCIDQIITQRQPCISFDNIWNGTGQILFGFLKKLKVIPLSIKKLIKKETSFKNSFSYIQDYFLKTAIFSDIKFAFKNTISSLNPGEQLKLILKFGFLLLIFSCLNLYIYIPIFKAISNKTSLLLSCLLTLPYIYLIDHILIKRDLHGIYRRFFAGKKLPRFIFIALLIILTPIFSGIFQLILILTIKLLNYLLELLGLEFIKDIFKSITEYLSSLKKFFSNFYSDIINSPFKPRINYNKL